MEHKDGKTYLAAGDKYWASAEEVATLSAALSRWGVYVAQQIERNAGKKSLPRWQNEKESWETLSAFVEGLRKHGEEDRGDWFGLTLVVGLSPNDKKALNAAAAAAEEKEGCPNDDGNPCTIDYCGCSGAVCGAELGGGSSAVVAAVPGDGDGDRNLPDSDPAPDPGPVKGPQLSEDTAFSRAVAAAEEEDRAAEKVVETMIAEGSAVGFKSDDVYRCDAILTDHDGYAIRGLHRFTFTGPDDWGEVWRRITGTKIGARCEALRLQEEWESFWRAQKSALPETGVVIDYTVVEYKSLGTGDEKIVFGQTGEGSYYIAQFTEKEDATWERVGYDVFHCRRCRVWDEYLERVKNLQQNRASVALPAPVSAVAESTTTDPAPSSSADFTEACDAPAITSADESRANDTDGRSEEDGEDDDLLPEEIALERGDADGKRWPNRIAALHFAEEGGIYEYDDDGVLARLKPTFADGNLDPYPSAPSARFLRLRNEDLGPQPKSRYALPIFWESGVNAAFRDLVAYARGRCDAVAGRFSKFASGYRFGDLISPGEVPDEKLRLACYIASAIMGACSAHGSWGGSDSVAKIDGVEDFCDGGYADEIVFERPCVRGGEKTVVPVTRERVFRELWDDADPLRFNRRNIVRLASDREALSRSCYGWQCPGAYDGAIMLAALPCPICGRAGSATVAILDGDQRRRIDGGIGSLRPTLHALHCLNCDVVVPAGVYCRVQGESVRQAVVAPHLARYAALRAAGIFDAQEEKEGSRNVK